jgi:large subunit ribosomal protein L24
MANKLHIKKDDSVKVLSGKVRGAQGRVLVVMPKDNKAIVEGVNLVKKHIKPNQQNPNGTILEQEAPIHLSNLQLLVNGKPTRVGRTLTEKGWVRVSKKTGEIIK